MVKCPCIFLAGGHASFCALYILNGNRSETHDPNLLQPILLQRTLNQVYNACVVKRNVLRCDQLDSFLSDNAANKSGRRRQTTEPAAHTVGC